MHLTIGLILTRAWRLGAVTCQNSQEGVGKDLLQFTAHNEREVRTLKPFSEPKNALREFFEGQNLLVNLPTGFPASSNRCRCTAAYSAIYPTVLASKQIRKSWYSRPKINYTHSGPENSFNGKLRLWSSLVRKHLQKHKPQDFITQSWYSICMEQTAS